MVGFEHLLVSPVATVKTVIETLNRAGAAQAVLVINENRQLLGVITDGDLRRGLLEAKGFDATAADIMHKNYLSVDTKTSESAAYAVMRGANVHQLPVLTENRVIVGLRIISELYQAEEHENPVVIMAGGSGRRLLPLTETTPKPMLEVGGRPILETIIQNFKSEGFINFKLAINYLGEQIREYFGDGHQLGVNINYIEEDEKLGTAGAISLLGDELGKLPILVSNGDVLTRVAYGKLLEFHDQMNSELTVCLREYETEVPYGVVKLSGNRISEIVEKPRITHQINAGIYVLNPTVIERLEPRKYVDMPDIIGRMLAGGEIVAGFPIHEYWMDVGRPEELLLADREFPENFCAK